MIRKFHLILLIAALSTLITIIPVTQAQDDDPNILAVTRIDSETIVVDEMENIGSPKLYTFLGSEGDVVTISMVADDSQKLDPYLVLLGSAGEVYAANDDISESDLSAQIDDFELPFNGAYFVLASTTEDVRQGGVEGDDSGDPLGFQIGLVGATVPAGMDADELEYFPAQLEIGDTVLLEITPEEPIYYVTFIAEEGDVVDIVTQENKGDFVDTLLYVFDRFGNRLDVAVSSEGDEFYAAITDLEIPEDGLYLVFATAKQFYMGSEDDWQGFGSFIFSID